MTQSYRWVIIAAGALMTCVALGAMFSLAIFLEPMSTATGWSRAGVSSAMTLNFLVMGLGDFAWGAVSDRFGTRIVVLIGARAARAGVDAGEPGDLAAEFQLTYGVLVGLAASAFFTPMIAAATAWFEQNRSLAVSLVSAGMGVAPMTISPFARWLITSYDDWRFAMLIIGILAWVLLLPAALLIRPPPAGAAAASGPVRERPHGRAGVPLAAVHRARADVLRLLRGAFRTDLPHGELCAGLRHRADVGGQHLQRRGPRRAGRPPAVRRAGRPARRQAGADRRPDRAGARDRELRCTSAGSASSTRSPSIFGTAYGGVMPLYAVLAREYFGQRIMGTVFGAATMTVEPRHGVRSAGRRLGL